LDFFRKISSRVSKLFCDETGFNYRLKEIIEKKIIIKEEQLVKIMFDISVCSSKLILNVIKTLFELNIDLTIVYTEAEIYYPLYSEYISDKKLFKEKNTVTNETVVLNSDFAGGNKVTPDLVISFPNFKAQRAKNIISEIDETILLKPDDRLIWIIGSPNINEEEKANDRKKMMIEINDIDTNSRIYEVSTLYYKKTIEQLESIYQNHNLINHINIADLGSKMQTIGICLYCLIRPEISIYHTLPKSYGTFRYSSGTKCFWAIRFGNLDSVRQSINNIDTINITN